MNSRHFSETHKKQGTVKTHKKTGQEPGLEAIDLSAENPNWKKAFVILIGFMLAFTWIVGWDSAFHSDEMIYNQYEKENFKYYQSFGKDTSFMNFKLDDGYQVKPHLRTYGGFFDLLATGTNKLTGIDKTAYEFNVRHLWIQLFGILAILFAGLIAHQLSGSYRMAIITSVIIFVTPTFFGHTLLNSKDIPFATGYTLGIYGIILLLKKIPWVSWAAVVIFGLGLACAMGTRVGGLLLICYLGLFTLLVILGNSKYRLNYTATFKSIVPKFIIAVVAGYTIAVLSWPFALMGPVKNVLYSLTYVSKFKENIILTFEGLYTDCNHLPRYYLIKWMGMTIPALLIILFFLSVYYVLRLRKSPSFIFYLLLLFAVIFPVAYAWKINAVVYSGWRHFLFIYPSAAVLMSLPVIYTLQALQKPVYKSACIALLFAGMLHPVSWMIRNHPYEYIYFNELSGGFKNNYYSYETETWQMSAKTALDWLYQNEHIKNLKDTVYIGTNAWSEVNYLVRRKYNDQKTQVIQVGYKGYNSTRWDYCIQNIIFLPPYYLKNLYPPYGTIHTVDIDNMPVCAIMKARDGRLDLAAVSAMDHRNFVLADSLLTVLYAKDQRSESVMEYMMLTKDNLKQYAQVLDIYTRLYLLNPKNANANYYAGIAYAKTGSMSKARTAVTDAIKGGVQTREAYNNLASIYENLGDMKAAMQCRQAAAKLK